MSAKRKRFDTRTILIVLFVIVIIAAAYIVVTNLPPEEEFLTVEEVLNNRDRYLNGDPIPIKGYYTYEAGSPVVVSTLSTTTGRASLELYFGDLDSNETDILRPEVKFKFTGVLKLVDENNPYGPVIFVVEKIEEV